MSQPLEGWCKALANGVLVLMPHNQAHTALSKLAVALHTAAILFVQASTVVACQLMSPPLGHRTHCKLAAKGLCSFSLSVCHERIPLIPSFLVAYSRVSCLPALWMVFLPDCLVQVGEDNKAGSIQFMCDAGLTYIKH